MNKIMMSLGSEPENQEDGFPREIRALFSTSVRQCFAQVPAEAKQRIEEVRLRVMRPIVVRSHSGEQFLSEHGLTSLEPKAYVTSQRDIQVLLSQVSGGAMYSLEEEIRCGYVTIQGGHRLGFTGQAVMQGEVLKTLTHLAGVNIRLARQVIGCSKPVLPYIRSGSGLPCNTLIISPPQCGKTTLLRDMVRILSSGLRGVQVAVVDERSEIAGCYHGVPQLDLGLKVDVLDRCPKAQGMILMVRSMSPQVVAVDEIGRQEDAWAVKEMRNAGVRVVTTVHGSSLDEVSARPQLGLLIKEGVFERYLVMSRRAGVGTVEEVLDECGKKLNTVPLRLQGEAVSGG